METQMEEQVPEPKSPPTSGSATGVPAVENLVEEPGPEMDLGEWLSRDDSLVIGFATLSDGRRVKIAALTERESNFLQDRSRKADPNNPKGRGKIDANILRKRIISFSLSKAAGTAGTPQEIQPEALDGKLSGELTRVQRQIQELSGMETERPDPQDFFA